MATPQEKPRHPNESWPLTSDGDYSHQDDEYKLSSSGCGCNMWSLCFWVRRSNGGHGYLLQQQEDDQVTAINSESWLKKNAKKLKEISEVLAGPKWKNFIRRFSKRRSSSMQFQYDPRSYELNFDEGYYKEADSGFPDFSTRFAAPPGIIQKG